MLRRWHKIASMHLFIICFAPSLSMNVSEYKFMYMYVKICYPLYVWDAFLMNGLFILKMYCILSCFGFGKFWHIKMKNWSTQQSSIMQVFLQAFNLLKFCYVAFSMNLQLNCSLQFAAFVSLQSIAVHRDHCVLCLFVCPSIRQGVCLVITLPW